MVHLERLILLDSSIISVLKIACFRLSMSTLVALNNAHFSLENL